MKCPICGRFFNPALSVAIREPPANDTFDPPEPPQSVLVCPNCGAKSY